MLAAGKTYSATSTDVPPCDPRPPPKMASFRKSPSVRTQCQIAWIGAEIPSVEEVKLDVTQEQVGPPGATAGS